MKNVLHMTPRTPSFTALCHRLAYIVAEAETLPAYQMEALAESCLDAFAALADAADAKADSVGREAVIAAGGFLGLALGKPGGAA